MMAEILNPQQLAQEGKRLFQKKKYAEAGSSFEAAALGFSTLPQADILAAAEMKNNQSVALLQAGQAEAAWKAADGTDLVFAQASDFVRQGMALGNLAAALEALNRLEEAAQHYEESAEVLKSAGESQLYLHVMQSLSALQLKMGRQLEAVATLNAGLSKLEKPTLQQRTAKKILQTPFDMMEKNRTKRK